MIELIPSLLFYEKPLSGLFVDAQTLNDLGGAVFPENVRKIFLKTGVDKRTIWARQEMFQQMENSEEYEKWCRLFSLLAGLDQIKNGMESAQNRIEELFLKVRLCEQYCDVIPSKN